MKKFSMFLGLLVLVAGMGTASASTITFITLDFNQGMPISDDRRQSGGERPGLRRPGLWEQCLQREFSQE